jgi:hypothetical protein
MSLDHVNIVGAQCCDSPIRVDHTDFFKWILKLIHSYYSKPIKGMDEAMRKKMHNVFMRRWSVFHSPIHSDTFAMDKQFCRREMDEGMTSKQVCVSICMTLHLHITLSKSTDNIVCTSSF